MRKGRLGEMSVDTRVAAKWVLKYLSVGSIYQICDNIQQWYFVKTLVDFRLP
jgi:hypothetical protein